jgi:hypothetical protein
MRATDTILAPIAHASGGSVRWFADSGVPQIRRVGPGRVASGRSWIGLRANGAYRVTEIEQEPLLPVWLSLLLVLGSILNAWQLESR